MAARLLLIIFFLSAFRIFSQPYPDQFYSHEKDSLVKRISSMNGMQIASDGKSIVLSDGVTNGYTIFEPDSSQYPFNRGLPSWNGLVPNDNSSFKILMRFYNNGWSPWLTTGYWKENIWPSYGTTSYAGGKIDIDNAVLNTYFNKWQFQVVMTRTSSSEPSPSLHKLSFFVSDQQATDQVNITSIVNDKPEAIFIPTEFFYQYALDPGIGGNICSPTSVSMVIRSYNIKVDPVQFAKDNYDPYWDMFGVWPRVVQNAVKFGLKGEVTRYRTWSEARKTLAAGGRVVMSVGKPLYTGHLIMLAGFDAQGNPICHDPAKSNGYSYKWDKTSLSQSWFPKGGVAYTFYLDSTYITSVETKRPEYAAGQFNVRNYPNPFNMQTVIRFETSQAEYTKVTVYDITGRQVSVLLDGMTAPGIHSLNWNADGMPTGNYFVHVVSGNNSKTIKALLLK